jgi:hypothetical protein
MQISFDCSNTHNESEGDDTNGCYRPHQNKRRRYPRRVLLLRVGVNHLCKVTLSIRACDDKWFNQHDHNGNQIRAHELKQLLEEQIFPRFFASQLLLSTRSPVSNVSQTAGLGTGMSSSGHREQTVADSHKVSSGTTRNHGMNFDPLPFKTDQNRKQKSRLNTTKSKDKKTQIKLNQPLFKNNGDFEDRDDDELLAPPKEKAVYYAWGRTMRLTYRVVPLKTSGTCSLVLRSSSTNIQNSDRISSAIASEQVGSFQALIPLPHSIEIWGFPYQSDCATISQYDSCSVSIPNASRNDATSKSTSLKRSQVVFRDRFDLDPNDCSFPRPEYVPTVALFRTPLIEDESHGPDRIHT